jgi:serine phosphatase RsbU (regulator of sigma subunit)
VGHDLHAAAVMGQVLIALRAYALDGRSPADVVTRLDRFMTEAEIEFATPVVVSYDPVSRVFEAVSAGHLPPLLILPDGDTRFLEMSRLPPVGCRLIDAEMARAATTRSTMPVGSTLLLFTDGLVECRGEPLDDGLERLKAAAASIPRGTPEQACDYLLTALMVGSRFGALAQAH